MAEIPLRPEPSEDREVDFLICKQCNTPCYTFDMEGGKIKEAQCLVCGTDDITTFELGDEAGLDDAG